MMHHIHFLVLATLLTASSVASADAGSRGESATTRGTVTDMPERGSQAAPNTPTRGTSMARVSNRYGEPQRRRGPVGEPPITRWDYADFSVFFEHDHVLHSVVPRNPPALRHRDELASGG